MIQLLVVLALSVSAHSAEPKISRDKFIKGMKENLPAAFCAEKAFFRQCFPFGEEVCKSSAVTAMDPCVVEHEKAMPAELNQADGRSWGEKIGACAGAKFEEVHAKEKKDTADCKDPAKWK